MCLCLQMSNWKKALDRSLDWVDDNTRDSSSSNNNNSSSSSFSAAAGSTANPNATAGVTCAEALAKTKCSLDVAKVTQESVATIAALRAKNAELERRVASSVVGLSSHPVPTTTPAVVLEIVPNSPRKMATGLVFGFCLAAAVGAGMVLGMEGMKTVVNRRNK